MLLTGRFSKVKENDESQSVLGVIVGRNFWLFQLQYDFRSTVKVIFVDIISVNVFEFHSLNSEQIDHIFSLLDDFENFRPSGSESQIRGRGFISIFSKYETTQQLTKDIYGTKKAIVHFKKQLCWHLLCKMFAGKCLKN